MNVGITGHQRLDDPTAWNWVAEVIDHELGAGYERNFDEAGAQGYRNLVGHAEIEVLHVPGTEEDAYLAAGKRVVDLADVMIAVWNGQPAKGKGGTADIVAYAAANGVPVVLVNPIDRTVEKK
ncbi:hypothetical protein ES708_10789 [subsurface metagenome]